MTTPAQTIATVDASVTTGAALRPVFFVLGLAFTALGIVGAFVPLMPSTVFLIVAAWFFGRSSARLENWLLTHPRFGPILIAWRRERAIPRRAKILACTGMAFGLTAFVLAAHPGIWLTLGVFLAIGACAAYVVTRPEPRAAA